MPFRLFGRKKERSLAPPQVPVISKEQLLKSKPIRNPEIEWHKYPSGEVAIITKVEPKGFKKVIARMYGVEPKKKILLDAVGSFVWDLCDGKHTVEDIIRKLMEKYKLHRREAETSLLIYLRMLSERSLIGFILPKPPKKGSK